MFRSARAQTLAGTFLFLAGIAGLVLFANVVEQRWFAPSPPTFGVTFVPSYAAYLGSDPRDALRALLDDLGVRHFRLTIPWESVEASRGQFTFQEIAWQLDEIAARGGDVILAIGRRTPRWPECHDPSWLASLSSKERDDATLAMLRATVNELKNRKEIIAWQVENEPMLFVFGACNPSSNFFLLPKEVATVRAIDGTRPVITTESGEISPWTPSSLFVDALGISHYHTVYNSVSGFFVHPFPAFFYRRRADWVTHVTGISKVFISELQAEPWLPAGIPNTPIAEQLEQFGPKTLQESIQNGVDTGLSPIYLWGAEWWYWLKTQGNTDVWLMMKKLFKESP